MKNVKYLASLKSFIIHRLAQYISIVVKVDLDLAHRRAALFNSVIPNVVKDNLVAFPVGTESVHCYGSADGKEFFLLVIHRHISFPLVLAFFCLYECITHLQ